MKKALVTGAKGFVGRHMIDYLNKNGWYVADVDLDHGGCEMFVLGEHVVSSAMRYDLVVHAAAAGPNRTAIDTQPNNFPYNVMLDSLMLNWAVRTKQRHFVYLSSCAIYPAGLQGESGWRTTADRGFPTADLVHGGWKAGDRRLCEAQAYDGDPFDTYGWTKRYGEQMAAAIRNDTTKITVVRPFSGYGEDQSTDFPFARFVKRAKDWQDPFSIWGSAEQVRDWIHIDDIIAGIMAAVDGDVEVTNLCTGTGTPMNLLASMMARAAGYHPQMHVVKDAPLGVHYRVGDPTLMHSFFSPKITIEEGVARAFRGWKR